MSPNAELLTTSEAAVVAGVEVRDVNRLIDEHILPEPLYENEDSRRIWAGACTFIRFYYQAAPVLTATERKRAIRIVCNDAKTLASVRFINAWHKTRPRWKLEDRFITLNFDSFVSDTMDEHEKLKRAKDAVVEDPEILSGAPVVRGTRVLVHDIAASVAAGISLSEIKKAYPTLTDELIDLAVLYAKATPARGRPRRSELTDNVTSSRKVVPRRNA